ncbi:MAG: ATP-dependent DNA ligase [Gammaproteobacteria bacterium]
MNLDALASASDAVTGTPRRTEKVRLLRECLLALDSSERETGVAWLAGVLPGGRLGLGPATVHALRDIAPASSATLTVAAAGEAIEQLRSLRGKGSAARRHEALAALFGRATVQEQAFLARLLLGELRQGALEGVMVDAIAAAAGVPAADVRRAVMLAGSIPPVAVAALAEGSAGLERFRLALYNPLSPMLASPTHDVASALAALGNAAFEYKLDGARAQIHKGADGVRIYSRTGRDVTDSLPDVSAAIAALPATSLILDAEVIALEPSGRPRPFQETMRRFGRKLDVDSAKNALPLSLFCFDCLHADGEDFIDRPAAERFARLDALLPTRLVVPRLVTSDLAAAQSFLRAALDLGHEGLMAKNLSSAYEAGSRGAAWLKIKVAHTLDLVVLAAEWGSGRRQGWLSNLHLGARDPATGDFVMLGKTFKGLTDKMLEWQTQRLQALAMGATSGYVVPVRPELVVEIAFNELQTSRRYPGGLALRFARVIRYREDKSVADADTLATVRAIAAAQRPSSQPTRD